MKLHHIASLLVLFGAGSLFAKPEAGDTRGENSRRHPSQRPSARENPRQRENPPPPHGPPAGRNGFKEFVKIADKDGDGAVSREEFGALKRLSNLPEAKRDEIFSRLDKNGDGFIRRDELRMPPHGKRARPPMLGLKALDKDGDGAVSYEEFLQSEFVKRLPEDRRARFFKRLDRNGDGKISAKDHRPQRRPERPDRPERRRDGRGGMKPEI